jgi:hypothetical protein
MDVELVLNKIIKNVKEGKKGYMNRIRYSKNGNRLESVKTFNHPTNGARYRVVLDQDAGAWYVVDAEGGEVAAKGQETSFHKVKKAAKKGLETLGILFTTEVRTVKSEGEAPMSNPANEMSNVVEFPAKNSGEKLG